MKGFMIFAVMSLVLHQCFSTGFCSRETRCDVEFWCHDHVMNEKINKQIAVELKEHLTFLNLAQFFEKNTNSFPNVAKYFREKAAEELRHAERFMQYQNERGGWVEITGAMIYKEGACADVRTMKDAFECALELEAMVTRGLTQLYHDASELKLDRARGTDAACRHVDAMPADDLRLTQPILMTVRKTKDGSESEMKTSNYKDCECGDGETNCHVVSYSYVELADMISHEFLEHQFEDSKKLANHYNTLKHMYGAKEDDAIASWLFDKHLEL